MSCVYCEEERNLFASAEGRACDIDEVAVGRLCFLSKDKQPKESHAPRGWRGRFSDVWI